MMIHCSFVIVRSITSCGSLMEVEGGDVLNLITAC